MKNTIRKTITMLTVAGLATIMYSCQSYVSNTTGWEYNNPRNGGFEVVPYEEQETGPGLILIEGGTFAMGRTEQDVVYDWDNIPRRVTVSSFYMDEHEIRNLDYLEYLYWMQRTFGADFPEVTRQALPDTLVWRSKLAFNEPYVDYYLRHPAYREYPVVGVSWLQASNYCSWRTDRVNEYILIREGVLRMDPQQVNENNFNTQAYLAGQYEGSIKNDLYNMDPFFDTRKVRMEDGIFLPEYRLPTEAEWEFAALGLIGNTIFERITERRIYPWNGHGVRNPDFRAYGEILANFVRGRGDYMGVAGHLNDNADVTSPVLAYWPNDYGLYGMAGNVSEWVMDVYRPLSFEDVDEFRPFRGNVFKTKELDEEGYVAEKDTLGRIPMREVSKELDDLDNRRNYRKADNINYLDGDVEHSVYYDGDEAKKAEVDGKFMYNYSVTSMLNDKARVYKGGSWRDRAYYIAPGSRRYLDENLSTADIGFRCAMTRVGSPMGMGY